MSVGELNLIIKKENEHEEEENIVHEVPLYNSYQSHIQKYDEGEEINVYDNSHECKVCNTTFTKASSFFKHLESHSKAQDDFKDCYYVCDICEEQFYDPTILFNHVQNHYAYNKDAENVRRLKYFCKICSKGFKLESSMHKHEQKKHRNKSSKQNLLLSSSEEDNIPLNQLAEFYKKVNDDTILLKEIKYQYECSKCGNIYKTNLTLKKHLKICSRIKDHKSKCHVCNTYFSTRNALKRHLNIHTGEQPYQCYVCERRFTQSVALQKHSRVHTKDKPYKCQICQRKFSQSGSLSRHMKLHTKDKPHRCDICSKGFTRSDQMFMHMRNHL